MIVHELKYKVLLEASTIPLLLAVILCAYKHWRARLIIAVTCAIAAFFAVWSFIMALGSMLVYTPACVLLWLEVDKNADLAHERRKQVIRSVCWSFLAVGVSLLIITNVLHIYDYLH